ncbi:hypothetical protein [Anaerobaca lacustris]|uniref:DUF4365 domain-containing protein n=1 Tax=Anaerobaca lacustris TaxID=3044600 RepID=A0AAW6TRG2_9BACT|nr:hypothetical protein [Sedimentisphaerales bacterium M17dextr]
MCIPFGFYQGNRSEYLAIPALSKLGFTIPIPRQEDHFGLDFIVHLAKNVNNTVTPTGRAFGIQIKSDKTPLAFDTQDKRDCLYNSSLPFFLGVISRADLTLTVYNTLNRLYFFREGATQDFTIAFEDGQEGLPKPDLDDGIVRTGRPILEVSIAEPPTHEKRLKEIEVLQSTMRRWVNLENKNLSLKEQGIGLLFWPSKYTTNEPLAEEVKLETHTFTKIARPDGLPRVCRATEEALTSLSFYLRKLPRDDQANNTAQKMDEMVQKVESLRDECEKLRAQWAIDARPSVTPSDGR